MESGKKLTEEQKQRAIAIAYARYLKDHNLKPGEDPFMLEPENEDIEPKKAELPKPPQKIKKRNLTVENAIDSMEEICAKPLFAIDAIQDKLGEKFARFGTGFVASLEKIIRSYKSSRKTIGIACLAVCLLCAVMLIVFDKFTVYEYAYNGKVLGYVDSQDDVTNVIKIASEQLNEANDEKDQDVEFTANDNISFNLVRAADKDTDDVDTTVNKLAYMTDVEVVASAIYDGDNLVTIVKDDNDAERLLSDVKAILGTPDDGMTLISSDFSKQLEIRPINVLLTSVQSNSSAKKQMTEGGSVKFYHLIEEGETLNSIAKTFGVATDEIYNEDDDEILEQADQGDKVCIHKEVTPVSVEMVEKGKMKEIVPYETKKIKTKKYYIGDEVVEQEGVKGVQIFEGTLTKVGGKVSDRKTKSLEVITEKVDKIIYVGTTKRPKTAPTGIFKNPMKPGTYIITSRPGWRWGRTHEGVDMGAHTGVEVYASDGGTITRAGWYGGYGNCIEVTHANGWMTRYGHLSYIGVHVGEKVYQGQFIGRVGSTGNSTGPHLHFETRINGKFVDPDTKVQGGL